MNEAWRRHRGAFLLLLSPAVLWLALFFLIPLALIWGMSFGERRGLVAVEITGTIANYVRAFGPLYLGVVWQSLWVSALVTVACLVIAYPLALFVAFANPRWRGLLLLVLVLPFWTNLLVRTYALIGTLGAQGYVNGLLGWLSGLFGLGYRPVQFLYTPGAVIFGLVYVNLPFMLLPLYAAVERLDRTLIEASFDLGASTWRTVRSVLLPLSLPGIVSGVVLVFIPSIGSFLTSDLLGGADAQLIGNVIERQFKSANDWPFGSALSFLLVYATLAVLGMRALGTGRAAA